MVTFWSTICKMFRPDIGPLSVLLSVCDVLWPNGWMDQDAIWYGGRTRPMPHYVRLGIQLPPQTWHTCIISLSAFYRISLPESCNSQAPLNHQSRWHEGIIDAGQRQRPVGFNHACGAMLTEVDLADHSGILILNSDFRG